MPKHKLSRPPFYLPLCQLAFEILWALFCSWTPKPFNPVRLLVLMLFGADVRPSAFIHSRARVTHPWNLTLRSRACLGDRSHAYALGPITLEAGPTVAQEAYLCTGSHDFKNPSLPLVTGPIVIGANTFVGVHALILPNVKIGAQAIVGAGAVVTRDVPAHTTVAGNPARPISSRNG